MNFIRHYLHTSTTSKCQRRHVQKASKYQKKHQTLKIFFSLSISNWNSIPLYLWTSFFASSCSKIRSSFFCFFEIRIFLFLLKYFWDFICSLFLELIYDCQNAFLASRLELFLNDDFSKQTSHLKEAFIELLLPNWILFFLLKYKTLKPTRFPAAFCHPPKSQTTPKCLTKATSFDSNQLEWRIFEIF